jgi:hypothetical protein
MVIIYFERKSLSTQELMGTDFGNIGSRPLLGFKSFAHDLAVQSLLALGYQCRPFLLLSEFD